MSEFYFPDYKGGSIVNLMSSISIACGGKPLYRPLRILSQEELKKFKNIVLIVIDGLGYEHLIKKQDSFLRKNTIGSITSVALPTTASAITTFLTGEAPQQHAITGWYMNLKEMGMVTTILPFTPRVGGEINPEKASVEDILEERGFSEKIKRKSFKLLPADITDTQFTKATSRKSKVIGFKNLKDMAAKLEKTIKQAGNKYIYAYWPAFDSFSHDFGADSRQADAHLKKLDKTFKRLSEKIKGTNTILLITADHGFAFLPLNKRIWLEDHPILKDCLTIPMCGEPRTKYCYVHPSKAGIFEEYVKTRLSKYCSLYKSEDIIARNLFGLGKPNPKLFDRLGDYILIMKKNYIIKDSVLGEKDHEHLGNHGGFSKEEMLVPLIVLKA
jgi:hypothetical protein